MSEAYRLIVDNLALYTNLLAIDYSVAIIDLLYTLLYTL